MRPDYQYEMHKQTHTHRYIHIHVVRRSPVRDTLTHTCAFIHSHKHTNVHAPIHTNHLFVWLPQKNQTLFRYVKLVIYSGVARPGPTRACALPSNLQALPSAISFGSRDSMMDQTKINCSTNNHKSMTNINATA